MFKKGLFLFWNGEGGLLFWIRSFYWQNLYRLRVVLQDSVLGSLLFAFYTVEMQLHKSSLNIDEKIKTIPWIPWQLQEVAPSFFEYRHRLDVDSKEFASTANSKHRWFSKYISWGGVVDGFYVPTTFFVHCLWRNWTSIATNRVEFSNLDRVEKITFESITARKVWFSRLLHEYTIEQRQNFRSV